MPRKVDWLNRDDGPSERDIEEFGYRSSAVDEDIIIDFPGGRVERRFWTKKRIALVSVSLLLLATILYAELAPLLVR
jgi:hypothetical protein